MLDSEEEEELNKKRLKRSNDFGSTFDTRTVLLGSTGFISLKSFAISESIVSAELQNHKCIFFAES